MTIIARRAIPVAVLGLACLAAPSGAQAPAETPSLARTATLVRRVRLEEHPNLGSLQNPAFWRRTIFDTAMSVPLGSLFCGLHHDPRDPDTLFWSITGNGPIHDETRPDGSVRRIFEVPLYDPAILRLRVEPNAAGSGKLTIAKAVFLKTIDERLITGLPGAPEHDEALVGPGGKPFRLNPEGINPRAVSRAGGDFWVADDYAPSLVRVAPDGRVRARFLPAGTHLVTGSYAPVERLPAVLARRKPSGGFEALALSADGDTLYAVMRSPLLHPDAATGEASRLVRILVFDTVNSRSKAEYVLALDEASAFGAAVQSDVGILDASLLGVGKLLVLEGTRSHVRAYVVDFSKGTNILASRWDDVATRPTLESLSPPALAAAKVTAATQSLLVDLNSVVPDLPARIEGLAIVDASTIVVGNDNGFPISDPPASELLFFRLAQPLPLE